MKMRDITARVSAGAVGAMLLMGVAGAAVADDDEHHGTDDVDVTVEIAETTEPGVLAMTVAGDSTVLTETGTDPTVREFTGTLPTVTVTDTRSRLDRINPDAYWYVLGSSSAFTGDQGQQSIPAGNLGWRPALVGNTDPGEVAAGDQVDTVLDAGTDAVGLRDQELLLSIWSSKESNPTGTWSVDAALFLKTPIGVAAGHYTSTLTLSLFEYPGAN